jgi:hypothetical protein
MYRTLACNFNQFADHRCIDAALDVDDTLEAIDLANPTRGGFAAIQAMLDRQLPVPDANGNAAEREPLVIGIDPKRHRRACS